MAEDLEFKKDIFILRPRNRMRQPIPIEYIVDHALCEKILIAKLK